MTDYTRYPTILPLPQLIGAAPKRQSGVVRVPMENGTTRNRRRFRGQPARASLRILYTSAQLQVFESWVDNLIDGGALPFTFPVLTSSGVIDHTVKMIDDYTPKVISPNRWEVNVQIEITDLVTLSIDDLVGQIEGLANATGPTYDALNTALTDYVTPN
jgi:hypothetical protein